MPKSESRFVDYRIVKDRVSITQILAHYGLMQSLRQINDDQFTGTCPIHKGENKTAFRVSISKNCWNCFSQCKCGGNILDFVSRLENVTLHKAALLIAEWFHLGDAFDVPIKQERSDAFTGSKKESAPIRVAEKATFKSEPIDETITENKPLGFALQHLEAAHPYFEERALSAETIATFGLGYCKKGSMTNHVVIPIHNAAGQLVAYAGRWPGSPPDPNQKYKLPKGFKKSLELFNLDRAIKEPADKPLLLVEGFFGCMNLHQLGCRKVVALMGSRMSIVQEELIRKHTDRRSHVIVMLDEDEAGQAGREDIAIRLARLCFVKVHVFDKPDMQPEHLTADAVQQLFL